MFLLSKNKIAILWSLLQYMVASSSLEYVDSIFGISSSSLEYRGCVHKTENNFYSRFQGTSQLENYFMRSDRANNISNLVCTSQLENYFMCSDRLRSMRMDVHGMSYEVCLQLLPLQVSDFAQQSYTCFCWNFLGSAPWNQRTLTGRIVQVPEYCDRKCSICQVSSSAEFQCHSKFSWNENPLIGLLFQEEYSRGEVRKMAFKHYYHIACTQHWDIYQGGNIAN
jgi:hypothetical protein